MFYFKEEGNVGKDTLRIMLIKASRYLRENIIIVNNNITVRSLTIGKAYYLVLLEKERMTK